MLDLITIILMLLFAIRGWTKGIMMAFFSIIAVLVAVFCCLKLSTDLSVWLLEKGWVTKQWVLPVTYVLLFLGIMAAVRMLGKAISSTLSFFALGWLNKLLGAIVYAAIAMIIWSSLLWLGDQIKIIPETTRNESRLYPYLMNLIPELSAWLGKLIPLLKDLFPAMEEYFDQTNSLLKAYVGAFR